MDISVQPWNDTNKIECDKKIESLTSELLFCYEELDFIFETGNLLFSLERGDVNGLSGVAGRVLDSVVEMLEADMGWICFADGMGENVEVKESRGIDEESARRLSTFFLPQLKRNALMVNASTDMFNSDPENGSAVLVFSPLKFNDRFIGALAIGRSDEQPYFSPHVKLMEHVAFYASQAIQTAKIFKDLDEAYKLSLEANIALEKLNEIKEKMMLVTSHEMKTPITILLASLEILKECGSTDEYEMQAEVISAMETGVFRMQRTIDNVCNLSLLEKRTIKPDKESIVVLDLVNEIFHEMAFIFKKRNLEPHIIIEADVEITAEKGMIGNVIKEILLNAVKHSPDGSTIEIRVCKEDRGTVVRIGDSGPCISKNDEAHIFEKFYKLGNVMNHSSGTFEYGSGGMSLGLAIVKLIIDIHGGEIWVECSPPEMEFAKGCCFSFMIPG
ncbi:MAG: GAF domain-containing sensor histidine kinase [Desulfobacteraceae bacterium]|nr:GAF domain-containing sensor histidine kinase [Desulfobacteraceae bacterium]